MPSYTVLRLQTIKKNLLHNIKTAVRPPLKVCLSKNGFEYKQNKILNGGNTTVITDLATINTNMKLWSMFNQWEFHAPYFLSQNGQALHT